jgi:hypothetical protein
MQLAAGPGLLRNQYTKSDAANYPTVPNQDAAPSQAGCITGNNRRFAVCVRQGYQARLATLLRGRVEIGAGNAAHHTREIIGRI